MTAPHQPRGADLDHATLRLALCALAAALGGLVVLDVVAPGAGPLTQPLSSYAHTGYAWLWRVAVLSGACGVVLVALGPVGRAAQPSVRPALLGAGAGLAGAGLCATDPWFPWERAPTGVGALHLAAVALVVAAFARALARGARATWPPAWAWARRVSRAARVAYGAALLGSAGYLGAAAVAQRPPLLLGLCERLLLAAAGGWCGGLAGGALYRGRGRNEGAAPRRDPR